MRALYVLLLVAAAGCLRATETDCGGGIVCPVGKQCAPGGGCALPEQFAACDKLGEGAVCTYDGSVGRCTNGVCIGTQCGNGIVDDGEMCDDAQTASECYEGGCRADCLKIETCGDRVVDCSEQCDDGNLNPADGCDACKLTTWTATALIGGNANAAEIAVVPQGVAVDLAGNVYVADPANNHVLRIDATGVVTPIAGSGARGFGGDGGAATSAALGSPAGVAVDGLGNIYIADTNNQRIRRVDRFGIITTIAGSGVAGFSSDGVAATSAQLNSPFGVAVDGLGNVYIADRNNHRIRRVDTAGIITTIAGTGTLGYSGEGVLATTAKLNTPHGVAVDTVGNVYIADTLNSAIRRVDAAGVITTIAGSPPNGGFGGEGGPATNALLIYPQGLAVDSAGTVYVVDTNNNRIRRFAPGGTITTVAGSAAFDFSGDGGPATAAGLARPSSVAVDANGNMYIADWLNDRVRQVRGGMITTLAGDGSTLPSGDGGAATSAQLGTNTNSYGIAVDSSGHLFIAHNEGARVRRVDTLGVITTVAGTGVYGPGGDGGLATSAQLENPQAVAVDAAGNLYIAGQSIVRRVDTAGIITPFAGTGINGYTGDNSAATSAQVGGVRAVGVDNVGNVYLAEAGYSVIRRVDTAGVITTIAGTGVSGYNGDGIAATAAQLSNPSAIAVVGGDVYIADAGNQRIRRIDGSGVITTVAGTGVAGYNGDGIAATTAQLSGPSGVAVDAAGALYISELGGLRVRRVDAAGVITTVAGTGTSSGIYDNGDGGMATSAQMFAPEGVAVDGVGGFYVADFNYYPASAPHQSVVRHVDASGVITTAAGFVDPPGMGPLARARIADARALASPAPFTLIAGGSSGTLQAIRGGQLVVVAGRYAQLPATAGLARFRDSNFGSVSGVAYDAAAARIYLTESSANRIQVIDVIDPNNANTWTIAPLANIAGVPGAVDGPAVTARFRDPTGLYFDPDARILYVADTGNHTVRAIDLATNAVSTVAGRPALRGYFGDGGPAGAALLFAPAAVARCPDGDLFIADAGNNRIRRVAAGSGTISTVLGDGTPASSGDGAPASTFPVNQPLGVTCDSLGNVYATSTTAVRLLASDDAHQVDGNGPVQTIYGAAPRDTFPARITTCLTGVAVVDDVTVQVTDSCTGFLVKLVRMSE